MYKKKLIRFDVLSVLARIGLHAFFMALVIFFNISAYAGEDLYPFNSLEKQKQFTQLTQQLRCLVCQNQSLADSYAPLAKDIKKIVYNRVKRGDSSSSIKHYFVNRYGNFILFKPPVNKTTYFLWSAPLIFLLMGVGLVLWLRKNDNGNYSVNRNKRQ